MTVIFGTRFGCNGGEGVRSNQRERGMPRLLLRPNRGRCYSRLVLAGDLSMGTDVLEFIYLVCFFLGLGFAVLSALLSGLFTGHAGAHMDGGVHGNVHGGHLHVDTGDGNVHYSPLSPVTIAMFISTFGGVGILIKRFVDPHFYVHVPVAAVAAFAVAGVV